MTLLEDLEIAARVVSSEALKQYGQDVDLAARLRAHAARLRSEFVMREGDRHGTMILCHVNAGPLGNPSQ